MLPLSDRWAPFLTSQPEAGMGYQIGTVVLKDGRRFLKVIIDSGVITSVDGRTDIPFTEADIETITIHNRR
jgi:hypothetical protein